ncbi:hypothetical protein LSPH24S_04207 [Lysinibacillus sphaericus]
MGIGYLEFVRGKRYDGVAICEESGGAGGDLEDLLNIVRLTGKYAAADPFTETTLANYLLAYTNLQVMDDLATYALAETPTYTLKTTN